MKDIKGLLDDYVQGKTGSEEAAFLAKHFRLEDEKQLQKVVVYLMDLPGEAEKPLIDKMFRHLQAADWREKFDKESQYRKKKVSQGYLAAGFLILLFLVLMYFLFHDKIQYDKTWQTVDPPSPVENRTP